jgi:electron transfer flavoprotein-quinone oxidoreductase
MTGEAIVSGEKKVGKDNQFDVIVVGAGPAGTTAAYVLAKAGVNVLLVERGAYPGAKNVFGGVLYTTVLNRLIPNFWEAAPVERHMKGIQIFLISDSNAVSIGVESEEHNKPPFNHSFTVSRGKFDQWFAQKAEEAGALLVTNTVVDDLLWYQGKVIGIKARGEEGEVYADVVIAADGVNSLLAEKAGLRKNYQPRQMALGVKEVIELPRSVIEDRFHLSGNEGTELKFVAGDATKGIWGGGNIYTNLDTLSVVTWVSLSALSGRMEKASDLMEHFKNHPFVKKYIQGGKTTEYQAHLAPDGGYDSTPRYCTNGLLVAGDAARFLNASLHYEGTNFAMASGEAAAKAVLAARNKGDYSAKGLSLYDKLLNESFVMKDLKRFRKLNRFAEAYPEFFDGYFKIITQTAVTYFAKSEQPKRQQEIKMLKDFYSSLKKLYASGTGGTKRYGRLSRKLSTMCPLARFLWQCIKGGLAFL